MVSETDQFQPDYAVPPGWVLEERLEVHGMSQAEFARRCGRSPKLISEIVSGKAPLEPATALQFEKVLGVDASIWLGIEADYRLHRARQDEEVVASTNDAWTSAFPLKELAKRGHIPSAKSNGDTFSELLSFFAVGSIDAWTEKYSRASVAYRHSPSFESDEFALATWLRLGELQAEKQECPDFSESVFRRAMREIRTLTRQPFEQALQQSIKLCCEAGVALTPLPPLPKTALSGAAWWVTPRKAIIQLSARHKTDDHFWFSFFHEAAHILLHSKKNVFVDGASSGDEEFEVEADEWAQNILVSDRMWRQFVATKPRTKLEVRNFAETVGIAPGIIVGMLQHEGVLPWTHLNGLKVRLTWSD